MEFTCGLYNPESIALSFKPDKPGYVGNWYGFRADTAERARIVGVALSINGTGNIEPGEITSLL